MFKPKNVHRTPRGILLVEPNHAIASLMRITLGLLFPRVPIHRLLSIESYPGPRSWGVVDLIMVSWKQEASQTVASAFRIRQKNTGIGIVFYTPAGCIENDYIRNILNIAGVIFAPNVDFTVTDAGGEQFAMACDGANASLARALRTIISQEQLAA